MHTGRSDYRPAFFMSFQYLYADQALQNMKLFTIHKAILLLHFIFIFGQKTMLAQNGMIVFQSDFGLKDGAVSAMKGVAMGVDEKLRLFDLTHEIPAYNIWDAAYRLEQTVPYWPAGTVFVSVVDPGVGTERLSVVMKTKTGHFIVTPDNGTLTLVAESLGIDSLRQIDESINRRQGSAASYTFHGRDVYAYTAARLASGKITFGDVGPLRAPKVHSLPYQKALIQDGTIKGFIPILDVQYGNVWTNIPSTMLEQAGIKLNSLIEVSIFHMGKRVMKEQMTYGNTFGTVRPGQPIAYLNSLLNLSLAINEGGFAKKHGIANGNEWTIEIKPVQ